MWFTADDPGSTLYGTYPYIRGWRNRLDGTWFTRPADDDERLASVLTASTVFPAQYGRSYNNAISQTVGNWSLFDPTAHTDAMWFTVHEGTANDNDIFNGSPVDATMGHGISIGLTVQMAGATVAHTEHPAGIYVPYLWSCYRSGATLRVFRSGLEVLSRTDASGAASNANSTFTFGGTGPTQSSRTAEFIWIARYDAAQYVSIHSYLATKYGIGLGWAPDHLIANLSFWADTSMASKLYDAATGTWYEKSGRQDHAAQGTVAARPQNTGHLQNGLPTLTFDGGDYVVTNARAATQPFTVGFVCDMGGGAEQGLTGTDSTSQGGPNFYVTGGVFTWNNGTAIPVPSAPIPGAHSFLALVNGASSELWCDGVLVSSGNPGTGVLAVDIVIGRKMRPAPTVYFTGHWMEYCTWNRLMTTGERLSWEGYCRSKWATP